MFEKPETKRKRQRLWVAKRRAEWFATNGPCKRCGSSERLELDHVDPDQKVSHSVFSWRKDRRDAELAKCQVLCRECHKKKTAEYMRQWARVNRPVNHSHGTTTEYRRGCRCAACKEAAQIANADYRRRTSYARQQLEEVGLDAGAVPACSTIKLTGQKQLSTVQ